MTDADRNMLAKYAADVSPVVTSSPTLLNAMKPMPLCVVCPMAQWYKIEDDKDDAHLECFCTTFRGVMFDRRKRAVTACDARTDAIDSDKGTQSRPG